jgi:hypothetical protein
VARLDQLMVKSIPSSIQNWGSTLRSLDLSRCVYLKELPDAIGCLIELRTLSINYCLNLQRLPDTISKLKKLSSFDARACPSLSKLPVVMKALPAFEGKRLWLWRARTLVKGAREVEGDFVVPVHEGTLLSLDDQLIGVAPLVRVAKALDR